MAHRSRIRTHSVIDSQRKAVHNRAAATERSIERTRARTADAEAKKTELTKRDAGRPRDDQEAQKGLVFSGNTFMQRLRKLNPQLLFEPSIADSGKTTGVYIPDPLGDRGRRFVGAYFWSDWNPEFALIGYRDAEKQFPYVERQGWRSCLARLIRQRLISEAGAEIMFGPPSMMSQRWNTLTK